jgi:hypothetical protein
VARCPAVSSDRRHTAQKHHFREILSVFDEIAGLGDYDKVAFLPAESTLGRLAHRQIIR